jgi:tetratricopeptide (TPR) repeat protein
MKKIILSLMIILTTHIGHAAKITNFVKPVLHYVNHEAELAQIPTMLNSFQQVSLVGISGIGKTQLARKYADLNFERYKLIWLFDGDVDLKQQFVQLARAINKESNTIEVAEGVNEAQTSVLTYLSLRDDFLIIVDNLKLNSNKKAGLFMNWTSQGHIIFCSQDAEMLPNPIKIPYLTEVSSKKLISNIMPSLSIEDTDKLAKELKGYPITIAKSAVFLKSNSYITFDEYTKYLAKSENDMEVYVKVLDNQLNSSTTKLLNQLVFFNNQNLSKSLIQKMSDKDSFLDNLVDLNRYQIIYLKNEDNQSAVFEMHDKLKEALIEKMSIRELKTALNQTVDKVNNFIPKGKNTKQELVLSDDTLIDNLEMLLIHCEKHKIDKFKILELKKNLMSFYLGMGVTRCVDLKKWFLGQKPQFTDKKLPQNLKAISAEFLILIGIYDYFINADPKSAMQMLYEAEEIINTLKGYDDLKYMVYSQLAQTSVHDAKMDKTLTYIEKAQQINTKSLDLELDATLLRYVESKYYFSMGDYKKSLSSINKFIDIIKDRSIDYYYAPVYAMKATILNGMSDYNSAYNVIKDVYSKEINDITKGNAGGIRLRAIIELSRAEFGRGNIEEALKYADQAINVYKQDESRKNSDLRFSIDTDLADAFIALK